MSATSPSPPPNTWKPLFSRHIETLSSAFGTPEFSLATISPPDASSYAGFPFPTPRVRTLLFRGFWLELLPNDKNPYWARFNPHIRQGQQSTSGVRWESEILTFTTNVRSHKVSEIFYSSEGLDILGACGAMNAGGSISESADADKAAQIHASGGGAYVEACFRVKSTDAETQWRIRGRCYLLALEDIDDPSLPHIRELCRRVEQRVRVKGAPLQENTSPGWSYSEEMLAHFTNMSPLLRAKFVPDAGQVTMEYHCGEPFLPGSNLPEDAMPLDYDEAVPAGYGGNGSSRGEAARKNFRVGVILPEIVDRVDLLQRGGAGRRWVYKLEVGDDGKQGSERWIEREVWP